MSFKALLASRNDSGVSTVLTDLDDDDLGAGDVTVRVEYSTVNYKDGLALAGGPIIMSFPLIPGIDLAGIVEASSFPGLAPGDAVVLNGYGLGQTHNGGYAQRARVKGEWLVKIPSPLGTREAMAIGTAGFTAMLCVMALEHAGLTPESGDVLVTGANGGVGSVAIALLSALGYHVVASTGRLGEADYLRSLGAHEIIDRAELSSPGAPIGRERWAGAVDAVGSHTLANVLAQTKYRGAVAACGLVQGADLPTSVMPFILRGVTLAGIDSVNAPHALRVEAWGRLARDLDLENLARATRQVTLAETPDVAKAILAGQVRGRVVVDVNG